MTRTPSGLLALCMLKAQSAAPQQKPLTFDVASVKPFSPSAGGRRGGGGPTGPGTADPGRIHYAAIRLKDLVIAAYNVNDFQIVGPAWLEASDETTRFTVDATMPPDTTKEQLRVMLQNLLAERFKLAIHRETRDLPKYSLIVAKGGPKMRESTAYQAPKDAVPGGGRRAESYDRYGFPNHQMGERGGTWSLQAKYDFVLTYSRPRVDMSQSDMPDWVANPPEVADPIPDLFEAVQSQMGLKLEAKKGSAEAIVIDHIEKKPTEN